MGPRVRQRVAWRRSNNHIIENAMIPTRSGLNLATDIHRPQVDGKPVETPLPVLLQRTPYDKASAARLEEAAFYTNRGYVTVMQDCRGRYDSEGDFSKYVDEGQDGYDTVEWLAEQPWCNGKIGTFGLSYAAHTQAALASLNPPHLAAMWLECGGFASAYHSGCRNGGAFELRQLTWAFREAMESPEARNNPDTTRTAMSRQSMHDWFARLPWKPGHSPLSWTPNYEDYLMEIWGHDTYDEYWEQVGLCALAHYGPFADVPQVHQCSWYDPYSASTVKNYEALREIKSSSIHLIMGPWTHGSRSVTYAGNVDFGPNATLDDRKLGTFNEQRLAFFDHWLKDEENGWSHQAPVKLFVMGGGSGRRNPEGRLDHGGRWMDEESWPPARVKETTLYLHQGGRLSLSLPELNGQASSYCYDPNHPVPTIGGNISSGLPIMEPGGFDQRESEEFYGSQAPYLPLASRQDVLVFQTDHLPDAVEVTGPVVVNLWVSSSAVDTDFTAKLIDVYPPSRDYPEGYALNLTDGILRTKFRESWSEPTLMEPGQVYPISIELYPTSNLFAPGHRIRVDVSSSNFPRLDVNGNTGVNPALSPIKITAINSVYHDRERPSHLVLWLSGSEC